MTLQSKADELLFVPLGGSGEIGGNLNLYSTAGKWLMVDCGVSFGEETTPGIELTMPDPTFIAERRDHLVGIVITHGHEDHIGALEYLWDRFQCPIYATPFTAALIAAKWGPDNTKGKLRLIEKLPGERWNLGPFGLEFVHVTHSIPDCAMLVVETKAGRVLHTGDWKFDENPVIGDITDKVRLRQLGEEGLLAVVGDSTNALVPGRTGSEAQAHAGLLETVKKQTGRVAVTCFSSNVARLAGAAAAAQASGRELALIGRSLWRVYEAAVTCGYWKFPKPLTDEEAGYLPRERALYVTTGSQGEPRSALARIAVGEHPQIVLEKGDTVIFSARDIPGNEKAIARVQNKLTQLGVHIITADEAPVHVSGHPARDELVELYQMARPEILIPVHGEARHQLAQVEIAAECQINQTLIPANGDVIRLAPGAVMKIDEVAAGQLGLDGKRLVKLRGDALRARDKMGSLGAAVVTLLHDSRGRLADEPVVTLIGLDGDADGELAAAIATMLYTDLTSKGEAMEAEAVLLLRRYCNNKLGKKPVTRVQIVKV